MIVDVNSFTNMVSECSPSDSIAQFVRDVLSLGICIVQEQGGAVVNFMGDAFLALFDNPDSVYFSCAGIAKGLDPFYERLPEHRKEHSNDWHGAARGGGLKIAVEYGWIDISTICSDILGRQRLLIGRPINYASRILSAGFGNRCLIGPEAMNNRGMDKWKNSGPYSVKGKPGEGDYVFWQLDLGDIWRESKIGEDEHIGGETIAVG